MRYARFKATVLGNEQSKKSRVGDKGGIQKPGKKGNQAKKDNIIKSESNVSLSSYAAQVCETRFTGVKQHESLY
jgi:hypothetical protein